MQRLVKTLLRQFELTQIKYRRPDVWAKMAERTESEIDAIEGAVYHDVENNELSMLLRVNQTSGRVLPAGSFTERAVAQLVQRTTGVNPISLTLLGPKEVLLDFEKSVSVVDVALVLHNMSEWDRFKVETSCLMAKREQLISMFQEREVAERERFQLKEEKFNYQRQLGQMVERIGSQIEQLDRKIDSEAPPLPSGIVTPPVGSPRQEVQQLVMAPGLPLFSGSEPTPRDEGTYDQWKFQVNGMRSSCTEPAVRSALITSLRGEASKLIGFVGFGAPLGAILEAMDKRFGKRSTTDRLQQEFFQLQQEKGERIQHFASRLEKSFRKLQEAFPDRYKEEQLKERLFHGVNQQTRDSMRFLYTKETTTYDSLLAAIKEAEIEWMESKGQFRMKSATVIDRFQEINELKQKLEKLTATVQSNSFKGARLKKEKKEELRTGVTKQKSPRKDDPRNMSKGPATTSAGPFKPNQKPFQCHKCQGWGHGWRECATKGNVDWARIYGESDPKEKTIPEKDQQ